MNNYPDNSGGRGRGGRGNRGRGSRGGGAGRNSFFLGRPIRRHEYEPLIILLSQLDDRSRRLLRDYIDRGLSRETSSGPAPPNGNIRETGPSPANGSVSNRKQKVFERSIIRDLPGVAKFSTMTSAERIQQSETNRLMSIATGAIARGRRLGMLDEDIRTLILSDPSVEALRVLFAAEVPSKDEKSDSSDPDTDMSSGSESDESEPMATGGADAPSVATNPFTGMPGNLIGCMPKPNNDQTLATRRSWASDCEDSSEEKSPKKKKHKKSKKRRRSKLNPDLSKHSDHNDKTGPSDPPPPGGGAGLAITA